MHIYMMHMSLMRINACMYDAEVSDAGLFRYEHTFNGRSSSSRSEQGYYEVGMSENLQKKKCYWWCSAIYMQSLSLLSLVFSIPIAGAAVISSSS